MPHGWHKRVFEGPADVVFQFPRLISPHIVGSFLMPSNWWYAGPIGQQRAVLAAFGVLVATGFAIISVEVRISRSGTSSCKDAARSGRGQSHAHRRLEESLVLSLLRW